ncbi:hypothetical protein K456DRAFT_1904016 [Colletotrichum gloeosporioides 23]|nr:hypothetical protein K456DRAFT_1904016 [Colletotrichum gloeosporioides 23]
MHTHTGRSGFELIGLRCKHCHNQQKKTYNTGHSPVVTDPTTTPALIGLSMGERTGSRVFQWVWSYVIDSAC